MTKEEAYEKIVRLVERFSEHIEEYKRIGYNEHQTRVDYINPFFKAILPRICYDIVLLHVLPILDFEKTGL